MLQFLDILLTIIQSHYTANLEGQINKYLCTQEFFAEKVYVNFFHNVSS